MSSVYTGVTLIKNNNVVSNFAEKTDVYCNDISDNEIREYISTGEPMDKVGAYEFREICSIYWKDRW